MKSDRPIDALSPGSRVVVFRLRALGDCVLSTPAIHLLKQYRPDLNVAVVCDSHLAEIYAGNPDIATVLPASIRAVRAFRPDLTIDFHGGLRSARLTLLSGAPVRAGYDMLRFQRAYNIHIPTAQRILGIDRPVHTAEHMASAMFHLGVPAAEVPSARVFPPAGRSQYAPAPRYAVIHPMASRPDKTWSAQNFVAVAAALPLEPVFVGGPADDLSGFQQFRTVSGAPLGEIARLARDADLFIGNDSGPAHLAAAVGTPQIVLFGPSNVETWAPWRASAEVLKADGSMETITIEQVLHAVARVGTRVGS